MNPIDLLPVKIPYSDPDPPDGLFFYENVVKQLLPDVLQLERTGIPINLQRVKEEVEEVTDRVLNEIAPRIAQNGLIQRFLAFKASNYSQTKKASKIRSYEFYYRGFNKNNVTQRSFIINSYLKSLGREKDCLDKWTVKDIKLYADSTGILFLREIISDNPSPTVKAATDIYYKKFCQLKADIYNKNLNIEIENESAKMEFNLGSSKQKSELFKFLGIKPFSKTKKGEDQWNRDNLEQLLKQLELELELEEDKDE